MPTFTYEERVKVCRAMETAGAAACPRCGTPVEELRMKTAQEKLLKRPGKAHYRCTNRACACECTPLSHLTAAPLRPTGTDGAPEGAPEGRPRSKG